MILGLAIIFAISYGITIIVIGKSIQQNNKAIIEKDIQKHVYNLTLYIKQYIRSSEIEENADSFQKYATDLGTILSTKFDERIIIYNHEGKFIFDSVNKSGEMEFRGNLNKDLRLALENKSAYTIINTEERFIVAVSVPILIDNQRLGIIRYFFDYAYLAQSSQNLFQYIHLSMLLIFIVLFAFIIMLSGWITKPIIRMKKATHMIARGNFDYDLSIHTNDELEDLADDFTIMKDNIQERIKEVEIERDNLIRLHKERKLFFDNVTHELKTPLTIISGYTQILQEYDEEDKTFVKKTLGNIKSETDRMHDMILDLLDAAKAESSMEYHFKTFNLTKVVKEIMEGMYAKERYENITIQDDIEEDITIYGDVLRIRQALINIIDNAIKYAKEEPVINIRLYKDHEDCYIVIKDRGIGISEEHLDNLFKPFYRVNKSLRGSSGLGLYIVKSIIKRHGGSVRLSSKLGNGTEVILKIPLKFTT